MVIVSNSHIESDFRYCVIQSLHFAHKETKIQIPSLYPLVSSHWKSFTFCESAPLNAIDIWITWRCLAKCDDPHHEPWVSPPAHW